MPAPNDSDIIRNCLRAIRDAAPEEIMSGEVLCEVPGRVLPEVIRRADSMFMASVAGFDRDLPVGPLAPPNQSFAVALDMPRFEQIHSEAIQEAIETCQQTFSDATDDDGYLGSEICEVPTLIAPIVVAKTGLPLTHEETADGYSMVAIDPDAYANWKRLHYTNYE